MSWHAADWDALCRRASGRRRYNSIRRLRAEVRRVQIAEHLRRHGRHHGVQKLLAERFGVSAATISRDLKTLGASFSRCPACGRYSPKVEAHLSR